MTNGSVTASAIESLKVARDPRMRRIADFWIVFSSSRCRGEVSVECR